MKNILLLVSLVSFISGSIYCQIENFELRSNIQEEYHLTSMLQLQDNSYVVLGLTKGDKKLLFINVDEQKQSVNHKIEFLSVEGSLHCPPVFITELANGEILFYYDNAIYSLTDKDDFVFELKFDLEFELKDFKLVEKDLYLLSKNGIILKTDSNFSSTFRINVERAKDFGVTSSGDIIVLDYIGGNTRFRKISPDGNLALEKEISEIVRINDFVVDKEDRIVAIGYLRLGDYPRRFGLVVRYDENLNWLDQESYDQNYYNKEDPIYEIQFVSISLADNNEYLIYGQDETLAASYGYLHFASVWDEDLQPSFLEIFADNYTCAWWNVFYNSKGNLVTYGFGYSPQINDTSRLVSYANEISKGAVNTKEEFEIELEVYPNPASTYLTVDIGYQADYQILNTNADFIRAGSIMKGINQISIEYLPAGAYLMKFRNKDGNYLCKRIIKVN